VVIVDAARVWVQVLTGRREPVLAEAPAEPSRLWAPSGLFPTGEDRARQAEQRQAEREPQPVGTSRDRPGGDW
jgi:carbon starvation protein